RRRGETGAALKLLDEVLEESPRDALALALRARCRHQTCDYPGAVEDAAAGLEAARAGGLGPEEGAACARAWLEVLTELGRTSEALEKLGTPPALLRPKQDARDAWALGDALLSCGRRAEAKQRFQEGREARGEEWEAVFAGARCERALGLFERAAKTLTRADELSGKSGVGSDPDVLVELGDV